MFNFSFKIVIIMFLSFSPSASADVKIFFFSQKDIKNSDLMLKDVARIETFDTDISKIENLQLSYNIIKDGYIDSKEIYKLVKPLTNEFVFIYGSSIKLFNSDNIKKKTIEVKKKNYIIKGDTVDVKIQRNGISLEMIGKAHRNARLGDRVDVELPNKKFLKGILKEGPLVEVSL